MADQNNYYEVTRKNLSKHISVSQFEELLERTLLIKSVKQAITYDLRKSLFKSLVAFVFNVRARSFIFFRLIQYLSKKALDPYRKSGVPTTYNPSFFEKMKSVGCQYIINLMDGYLLSSVSAIVGPYAVIPQGFFGEIHGVGIASRVVIEDGVKLHVNVQIFPSKYGAPVLKKGCIVYSNASLCGEITVGEGAVVGANSYVITNVAPNSTVIGVPAKVLLKRQ